jgi:PAS domain S-box-containing protein
MPSLSLEALALFPLEESATLLKYTLLAAQAGSWVWDVAHDQCFWSEEFHLLVGTDPATCRPSCEAWLRTIHPQDRDAAFAEMEAALRDRRELNNEFRVVRPDGVVRWMRSQGQALYDKDGTPLRMMGVMFDITERKQTEDALRQREEDLRIITDGLPVLISYVDSGQRYRFNNRMYEEWFGLRRDEIRGVPVHEVLGEAAYQDVRPHIEAALAGREVRYEMWLDYKTVGKVCVEVRYVPDFGPGGEVRGFFALINDISNHKQAQAALRESEERLRESDRRKDEFLAVLAHELRNPLAPIRNAVHVMQRLNIQDPQLQRMRDVLDRQTEQLSRLVDDLLDISRIGQGKTLVSKARLDLRAIVERAVEVSRPAIDGSRHRLQVSLPSTPLRLDGDEVRLVQVVSNLLNNAAKYTEPGGSIRLSVDTQGGEARIRVEDNGIGMSAEFLPVVFDLFAQADRTSERSRGGLGIGLALVRRLVELHGGTVHADSAGPGCGSVFTVRLPLAPEPR